jgi:Glycosyl transferase family 2
MSQVTVLIPNYNREEHLGCCLESIRAQTFTDWTAIIGDNASTDQSAEIVRSFEDPRFRLVQRKQNIGYIRNTNLLIAEVQTELVAILHSDDWWEPDFLVRLIDLLDCSPSALIAVCAARHVFETGTRRIHRLGRNGLGTEDAVLTSPDATRLLVRGWPFLTPSSVLARSDLYKRLRFEESLPYSTDWLMWLRASSIGAVAVSTKPMTNVRKHRASVTGEAEGDVLWADEWIRLAAILDAEWEAGGTPYPGAGTELWTMNALRFLMKSYELLEGGNRGGALKLTRLARQTAPTTRWRTAAGLVGLVVRATSPAFAGWLRRSAGRAVRRMSRPARPRAPRDLGWSAMRDILTVLRES